MFLAYLTLFTALAISGVAIFYSVVGLAAIFAAAVVPIIIMGGILESAKLVTAVWLHKYWHRCVWWLKTYLALAVLVLMFITSMGIFGFLSRAHIEQTSLSIEQAAQSAEITEQLERLEGRVERWNEELDRLFSGSDVRVDSLLTREQEELNAIYARIEREKNQLRQDAQNNIAIQNTRLEQAQARKEQAIEIARQRFSGASNQSELDDAIQRANSAEISVASAVQREIISINRILSEQLDAVDSRFEDQISDVQGRINQLRTQSTSRTDEIDRRIIQLEDQIREEQLIIADLRQQRSAAEREFRMLEAEVGPIKYIAEFIYGEKADKELLEEAVRWVIIIIIFVFDPLAVLLLIASQFTFQYIREDKIARGETVADSRIDELFGLVAPAGPLKAEPEIEPVLDDPPPVPETDTVNKPEPQVAIEQETADVVWDKDEEIVEEFVEEFLNEDIEKPEKEAVQAPEPTAGSENITADAIETEGVTYAETCDGYVRYKNTLIQKEAFKNQHSEMWKAFNASNSTFGTQFPKIAKVGDIFVRVDMNPNRAYKFEGTKWVEVDKENSDTYLFDEAYIQFLISSIERGEYDIEMLSDKERQQIEEYLTRK